MTSHGDSKSGSGPTPVFRVLVVCSGNTCRSPMAAGILKKAIADLKIPASRIDVQSAGTLGLVGRPATPLAIETAAAYGVDITAHRSQGLSQKLLNDADLVLAMAAEHYDAALALGKNSDQLFMLRSFPRVSRNLVFDSIDDPIGGDRQLYERAYLEIDEAIMRALPALLERAGVKS